MRFSLTVIDYCNRIEQILHYIIWQTNEKSIPLHKHKQTSALYEEEKVLTAKKLIQSKAVDTGAQKNIAPSNSQDSPNLIPNTAKEES